MSRIALLGTGLLGSGMARRFLDRGISVTVWNRTPEKTRPLAALGADVAPTAAEAVDGADWVHLVLADDGAVDDLLGRLGSALRGDAVVVDHSTTLPEATAARAVRLARTGVRFLHAPVFMSPQAAANGGGLMMIAGPEAIFAAVRTHLESMAGEAWFVGERPDLAAAFKLYGNLMLFAINGALADVLALARATQVDPHVAISVFKKFQAANGIHVRGPKMADRDFTASFAMTMARKDAALMLQVAGREPLIVLPAVVARMDAVIAAGGGGLDLAALGGPDLPEELDPELQLPR